MGIVERKAKEKEELKSLILDAAMKLFVEKGIEHTTIRNIADKIDYSIGTVYVYYKDKNEIFYDINQQGFTLLKEGFLPCFSIENPMDRLEAMCKAYVHFALNNKELYDLIFIKNAPMLFLENENQEWCEGKATFKVVIDIVNDCMASGYFKGHNARSLALNIWSTIHGLCSLHIHKRLDALESSTIEEGLDEFLKLIRK